MHYAEYKNIYLNENVYYVHLCSIIMKLVNSTTVYLLITSLSGSRAKAQVLQCRGSQDSLHFFFLNDNTLYSHRHIKLDCMFTNQGSVGSGLQTHRQPLYQHRL